MSPSSNGPATAKANRSPSAASASVAQDVFGFDAATARRLAFVRWLMATGRLREQDPATPPREAAGAAPPAVTRAA